MEFQYVMATLRQAAEAKDVHIDMDALGDYPEQQPTIQLILDVMEVKPFSDGGVCIALFQDGMFIGDAETLRMLLRAPCGCIEQFMLEQENQPYTREHMESVILAMPQNLCYADFKIEVQHDDARRGKKPIDFGEVITALLGHLPDLDCNHNETEHTKEN